MASGAQAVAVADATAAAPAATAGATAPATAGVATAVGADARVAGEALDDAGKAEAEKAETGMGLQGPDCRCEPRFGTRHYRQGPCQLHTYQRLRLRSR